MKAKMKIVSLSSKNIYFNSCFIFYRSLMVDLQLVEVVDSESRHCIGNDMCCLENVVSDDAGPERVHKKVSEDREDKKLKEFSQ